MRKNQMHFVVLIGFMAGNLAAAQAPAPAAKVYQKGRLHSEKKIWQRGIAAAKKRHWNKQLLTRQERDYYNAVLKRVGTVAGILAIIGAGYGVKKHLEEEEKLSPEEEEKLSPEEEEKLSPEEEEKLSPEEEEKLSPAERLLHLQGEYTTNEQLQEIRAEEADIIRDIYRGYKIEERNTRGRNLLHQLLLSFISIDATRTRLLIDAIGTLLSSVSNPAEMVNAHTDTSESSPLDIVLHRMYINYSPAPGGIDVGDDQKEVIKLLLQFGAVPSQKNRDYAEDLKVQLDQTTGVKSARKRG